MAVNIAEFLKLQKVSVAVDAVLEESRILKQRLGLAKKHFNCGDFEEGAKLLAFFFSHLQLLDGNLERLHSMRDALAHAVTQLGAENQLGADAVLAVVEEPSHLEAPQRSTVPRVEDLPPLSALVKAEQKGGFHVRERARMDRDNQARSRDLQQPTDWEEGFAVELDDIPRKSRLRRLLKL